MKGWVAGLAVLLAASAATARPRGAVANAQAPAVVGQTATIEIEAPAGSKGLIFNFWGPNGTSGATISGTSLITASSTVVTPTAVYGDGPLTAILRRGTNAAGLLPGEGAWLGDDPNRHDRPGPLGPLPIFLPPGKFLAIRAKAVNTALNITVGWVEVE